MQVDVLTLFPGILTGFLETSLVRQARQRALVEVRLHDFRRFATDAHRSVDDKPFGGGPGMVLKPQPVHDCLSEVVADRAPRPRMLLPSPVGRTFDQALARDLAREEHLVFLCGRYEGYDERIVEEWGFEEVSLGDFVVMGGEVPAMAMMEAVFRLVPGVLGHDLSAVQDSFEAPLLDHPHYTRPAEFRGRNVPDVLLSGDHQRIAAWRRERSLERTQKRRPDLLEGTGPQGARRPEERHGTLSRH